MKLIINYLKLLFFFSTCHFDDAKIRSFWYDE